MQSKFKQVPVDEDTRILYQHEAKLADYDILHQMWSWDGVTAESIIFDSKDVSGLSDNELEGEVRKSPILKNDSSITLTRTASGFTFANFNFET
jgi:hypothetical protein